MSLRGSRAEEGVQEKIHSRGLVVGLVEHWGWIAESREERNEVGWYSSTPSYTRRRCTRNAQRGRSDRKAGEKHRRLALLYILYVPGPHHSILLLSSSHRYTFNPPPDSRILRAPMSPYLRYQCTLDRPPPTQGCLASPTAAAYYVRPCPRICATSVIVLLVLFASSPPTTSGDQEYRHR